MGLIPLGAVHFRVTPVALTLSATNKLMPFMVGFCTCPISGEIADVGKELICVSTSSKEIGVVELGMGTGTEAVWQKVKTRGQAEGKGSPYCTLPKSWSVVIGGSLGGEAKALGAVGPDLEPIHTGDNAAGVEPVCKSPNKGMLNPTIVESTLPPGINGCAAASRSALCGLAELGPTLLNSGIHADPLMFRSKEAD